MGEELIHTTVTLYVHEWSVTDRPEHDKLHRFDDGASTKNFTSLINYNS